MNEEYNLDLVTVTDDDGNEHVFEELDRIETNAARYVALLQISPSILKIPKKCLRTTAR